MKLDTFEWFKENNPHLVDKNMQVVRTTDKSTIVFLSSFDNIYLSELKNSDHGVVELVSGLITKVTGGYELQLYVSNKNELVMIDDMDKIEMYE